METPKVIGTNNHILLNSGGKTRVILLNNAATTPPFEITLKTVNEYLQTYGALHRGAGPHANITFQKTEEALKILRQFLGVSDEHALLFTSNTSSAINLFIRLLRLKKDDVIITSIIEHTSNNLPWKYNTDATTVYVNAFDDGALDYDDLQKKVAENAKNIKLIAITGASNLTGYIPDIERISKLAHKHNALLFIGAAQLAPHRPINMAKQGIDSLAFSAHKVYAPFGLGVLALPKQILETPPVDPGGGSIDMISETDIVWAPPIARHQTGTWNVTGIIAAAASCKAIMDTGWDKIIEYEKELVEYAAKELQTVPDITLYVPAKKYLTEDRTGNFTFNLKSYHHALLSAILENEYGIETRAGTICNHRLVRRWFKIDDATQKEIDALVSALKSIAANKPALKYKPVPIEEIYVCEE